MPTVALPWLMRMGPFLKSFRHPFRRKVPGTEGVLGPGTRPAPGTAGLRPPRQVSGEGMRTGYRGDIGATESIGVADPNPRYRGMQPSLANVGTPNILQRFLQGRQSIADRIERNRIERLMQYRTRNPYFPTGGRY